MRHTRRTPVSVTLDVTVDSSVGQDRFRWLTAKNLSDVIRADPGRWSRRSHQQSEAWRPKAACR